MSSKVSHLEAQKNGRIAFYKFWVSSLVENANRFKEGYLILAASRLSESPHLSPSKLIHQELQYSGYPLEVCQLESFDCVVCQSR